MKHILALIEKGKDGNFGIFTPELQSTVIGEGKSVAEAKRDFENSYSEVRRAYVEDNQKVPDELQNAVFIYKFDMASVFDFFDVINVSKFAQRAKINPSLMRQYKSCGTYISEKQAARIEAALHQLGRELLAVKL